MDVQWAWAPAAASTAMEVAAFMVEVGMADVIVSELGGEQEWRFKMEFRWSLYRRLTSLSHPDW